jgi:hypothetical protein
VSGLSDSALLTTDTEVSLFTAGFKISYFTIHEYLYNNCVVAKLGTASTGKFINLYSGEGVGGGGAEIERVSRLES